VRWMTVCMAVVVAAMLLFLSSRAHAALYWTGGSGVAQANTNGSEFDPEFIAADPAPFDTPVSSAGCEGVAIDASHIYWSEPSRGSIARANLDGSGVEYNFLSGLEGPCGIAVDATSLYWTERERGTISKAGLDGGGVDRDFINGIAKPGGVAVGDGYVYWTSGHFLIRAPLSGGLSQQIHIGGENLCGVALDAAHVYWGEFGKGIGRARLDGSDPEPSFITGIEGPCGIALQGGYIYWTQIGPHGGVQGTEIEGSHSFETIVNQGYFPFGIAADSTVLTPPPPPPSILLHSISFRGLRHGGHSPVTFIRIRFRQTGSFTIRTGSAVRWQILSSAPNPMTLSEPGERLLKLWPATGHPAKALRARLRRTGKAQVLVNLDFNAQNGATWTQGKWLSLIDRRHAGDTKPVDHPVHPEKRSPTRTENP